MWSQNFTMIGEKNSIIRSTNFTSMNDELNYFMKWKSKKNITPFDRFDNWQSWKLYKNTQNCSTGFSAFLWAFNAYTCMCLRKTFSIKSTEAFPSLFVWKKPELHNFEYRFYPRNQRNAFGQREMCMFVCLQVDARAFSQNYTDHLWSSLYMLIVV